MYQHDLSDKGITDRLRNVVEDCVNVVGVDVNTASADLLRYVSGLSDANVREIMAHRSGAASASASAAKKASKKSADTAAPGRLVSLADLRGVKGIGPKTFNNCAGFLRIYDGTEPLDATNIHPDDYALAREMLKIHKREADAVVIHDNDDEQEAKRAKKEKREKKEKKHKKDRDGETPAEAEKEKETTTESPTKVSFWEGLLSTPAHSSKDPYDLLRTKTAAELEQIWAWLQEARIAPQSSSAAQLLKGPYMSQPKLLQRLPADFQAKIEVGSVVQGVIRNVTTFGAFVDLGGVEIHSEGTSGTKGKGKASCDGLLHSSKYRDYFNKRAATGSVKTPANAATAMASEIYVGREVKVKIISIDDAGASGGKSDGHDKRRIALDLLELL